MGGEPALLIALDDVDGTNALHEVPVEAAIVGFAGCLPVESAPREKVSCQAEYALDCNATHAHASDQERCLYDHQVG